MELTADEGLWDDDEDEDEDFKASDDGGSDSDGEEEEEEEKPKKKGQAKAKGKAAAKKGKKAPKKADKRKRKPALVDEEAVRTRARTVDEPRDAMQRGVSLAYGGGQTCWLLVPWQLQRAIAAQHSMRAPLPLPPLHLPPTNPAVARAP